MSSALLYNSFPPTAAPSCDCACERPPRRGATEPVGKYGSTRNGSEDAGVGTRVPRRRRLDATAADGRQWGPRGATNDGGTTRAGDASGRDHAVGRLPAGAGGDELSRAEQRRRQTERRPPVRRLRPNQRYPDAGSERDRPAAQRGQQPRGLPHVPRGHREVRVRRPLSRVRPRPCYRRLSRRRRPRGSRRCRPAGDRPRRRRCPARDARRRPPRALVSRRRRLVWGLSARSVAHDRDDRSARRIRRLLSRDEFRPVSRPPRAGAHGTPRSRLLRERRTRLSPERRCHGNSDPRCLGGPAAPCLLQKRLPRDRPARARRRLLAGGRPARVVPGRVRATRYR